MLDRAPDLALGEIQKDRQDDQIDHDAETHPVPLLEFRLRGRPGARRAFRNDDARPALRARDGGSRQLGVEAKLRSALHAGDEHRLLPRFAGAPAPDPAHVAEARKVVGRVVG